MIEFDVKVNNGIVDGYWFEIKESGIKHLLINTTNKWIPFSRSTNNIYYIYKDDSDVDGFELKIPELTMDLSGHICTELQNKDQISFYWIPRELLK